MGSVPTQVQLQSIDQFLRGVDQLHALHRRAFKNRSEIESSVECGCFSCQNFFKPDEIKNWCDPDSSDRDHSKGTTALCPRCGIDSVLSSGVEGELTPLLLKVMHFMYFERAKSRQRQDRMRPE